MQAWVMVDAGFPDAASAELEFAHQLHADGAAGGRELDLHQQVAADQAVVAIDIAYANAEQEAGAEVVDGADPHAVRRIVALKFITVNQANAGGCETEKAGKLRDVVL